MRKPIQFNSNQFIWGDEIATAEASDLRIRFWPKVFSVRSNRTGDTRLFIQSDTIRDAGGEDLVAVVYICPGSGIQPIHILND